MGAGRVSASLEPARLSLTRTGTGDSEASNGWGRSPLHSFAGIRGRSRWTWDSTNQPDAGRRASAGSMLVAKPAAAVTRRHRWLSLALQKPRCLHGTSSAASQRPREDVVVDRGSG
jgi:hypothetical protein